jgi:hypothetical protein
MDINRSAKPKVPSIKNLAPIDKVGVLAFSCTTSNSRNQLWADFVEKLDVCSASTDFAEHLPVEAPIHNHVCHGVHSENHFPVFEHVFAVMEFFNKIGSKTPLQAMKD